MKSTIQIKQISGLIFSLICFFVCNNHNVFAESLSMTLNGVDVGNELNFDFDKGAHEAAKVRDILMNVRTDNRSGYKVMILVLEQTRFLNQVSLIILVELCHLVPARFLQILVRKNGACRLIRQTFWHFQAVVHQCWW